MALIKPKRKLILPAKPAFYPRRKLPKIRSSWVWVPRFIPIRAAVGFDTSGFHNSAAVSVSTLSNNFAIGAALSNGAMVGFLGVSSGTQLTSPSMTWNAVSMGLIGSTTVFDSLVGTLVLFGLVAPAGGTHSLSASWTGAGPATIGFWSFSGVDQTGGATTFKNGHTVDNGGANASTTNTVTTTSGNGTVTGWGGGQTFSGTQTPTQDWQDNSAGNLFSEGQHILSISASSSFTATISAADGLIGSGCDILAAAGGAATPTWGFTSRREDERPTGLLGWRANLESSQTFFRPSQIPVPTRWLPTTGQEDRPPPASMRPDDSSIENRRWFARSPNPVPTSLLPTTGAEDRPPPPWRRPDDSSIESPLFFRPSPNPVPTTWLPTAGEQDHPPVIKRPPDEPTGWFLKATAANTTPSRWLPTTGEDIEHPVPPPRTDWAPPWFAQSPNPVPQRWLPTTGEEDRPPNPNRIPALDQPFPWFVRSSNPVPATWLPTTGEEDRPPAQKRPPDEPGAYFRVPASFLPIFLPTTGQEDRPPPFKPDFPPSSFIKQPPPAAGISGMAWFNPSGPDGKEYPGVTNQQWSTTWAPQVIVQLAPTIKPEWLIRARRRYTR